MEFLRERKVALASVAKYDIWYEDNKYSRYYDRVMFPVKDFTGKILTYQGRALYDWKAWCAPKYLHGPYDKSRHLYGLYEAFDSAVVKGFLVLVEGPLDVVACYQSGIPAVATLGTALSRYQAALIAASVPKLAVWADADEAGKKFVGTVRERTDGLALQVRRVKSSRKDASDYYRDYGRSALEDAVYGVI